MVSMNAYFLTLTKKLKLFVLSLTYLSFIFHRISSLIKQGATTNQSWKSKDAQILV